jgi:hypothetical protein
MGLLQNGYRHNLTGKLFGGTALDGANPSVHVYHGHRTAANRNQFAGQGMTDKKAAVPNGNLAPSAWILPQNGGGMSSRSCSFSFPSAASGVLGMPGAGTATITFTVPDVAGQMIVSGSGAAGFAITTNTPLLTASINGTGGAAFTFSATGDLGALADLIGDAAFSFSATGALLPEDDTSPLRTAAAAFSFTGAVISYALGHMQGSTDGATEISNNSISAAVWSQVIDGGYAAEDLMKLMSAALAGKVAIVDDTVIFRDVGDSKNRIVAVTDGDGNRTAITVDLS